MTVGFDSDDQIEALKRNLTLDLGIYLKVLIPLVLLWVVCGRRTRQPNSKLIAIPILVIGAYTFLNSEGRLTGIWFAIAAVTTLAGITTPAGTQSIAHGPSKMRALVLHLAVALVCLVSVFVYTGRQALASGAEDGISSINRAFRVAERIRQMGVRPGSRVALVGDESDIYWARLSGVQVAVQIPLGEASLYWGMSQPERTALNQEIATEGAVAVIASWTAPPTPLQEWSRIPDTNFRILPLH